MCKKAGFYAQSKFTKIGIKICSEKTTLRTTRGMSLFLRIFDYFPVFACDFFHNTFMNPYKRIWYYLRLLVTDFSELKLGRSRTLPYKD
jgi:hypothetical protein